MIAPLIAAFCVAHLAPAAPALSAIHTEGTKLVNAEGKEVRMRGVNLGGWLVEEIWMTPWAENPPAGSSLPKVDDSVSLWSTIEKRLGKDAVVRIRDKWRDNWITDADFKRIKDAGFDHVRVPFLYTMLQEPKGMDRLRWAVNTAAKHGLYTILDMHGVPGRQSTDQPTGMRGQNRLWFDVENITQMENLWVDLGKEFGDNPNVAMFDLMNEPMGAPNPAMLHLVYNRVIQAVRKVAPKKVVLVDDGYKGFDTTPHPNLAGWTNVAFSLHFYNFDSKTAEDHVTALKRDIERYKPLQGYRNAPLYVGEFNLEPFGGSDVTKRYTQLVTEQGWSWTLWTYKTDAPGGPMGQWGLYRRAKGMPPISAFEDSEQTILKKIEMTRTENMEPTPGLLDALKR